MTDGVLVIDKPAGPTSHDVVARVRRALGEKRIGHTGTLDPMATGVLALVIGRATRLAPFLSASDKEYDAAVRLGTSTDTYDALGRPLAEPIPVTNVSAARVEEALAKFRGSFEQMPPPFSAKKIAGVPAYKLARKQKDVVLSPVPVTVRSLDLLELTDRVVKLRMTTSAGFYVRSLAHDLGAQLGCGGCLEALRRTRSGTFALDRSMALEEAERHPGAAVAQMISLPDVLSEMPAVRVTSAGAERTAHGNSLRPEDFESTGPVPLYGADTGNPGTGPGSAGQVRVLDGEGRLLAIAKIGADGLLRPAVVLV